MTPPCVIFVAASHQPIGDYFLKPISIKSWAHCVLKHWDMLVFLRSILLEFVSGLENVSSLIKKPCANHCTIYMPTGSGINTMDLEGYLMAPMALMACRDLTCRFWPLCIKKYLKECMSSFSCMWGPWLWPWMSNAVHKGSLVKLLAKILRRQPLIFDTCYTVVYHSLCSWSCIMEPWFIVTFRGLVGGGFPGNRIYDFWDFAVQTLLNREPRGAGVPLLALCTEVLLWWPSFGGLPDEPHPNTHHWNVAQCRLHIACCLHFLYHIEIFSYVTPYPSHMSHPVLLVGGKLVGIGQANAFEL